MPTGSAPPNYYSDPHTSQKLSVRPAPLDTEMHSSRFPDALDLHTLRLYHRRSAFPSRRRNSAESDLSPGYESDAESIGMPSHLIPSKQIPGPRSMLPSPDSLIWNPEQEVASSLRRRHSDGHYYSRRWKFPAHNTTRSHEEGRGYPSVSSLHPYVSTLASQALCD